MSLGRNSTVFFCLRCQEQEASDSVQETLIRLYEKVQSGHYQEGKGSLQAFAYGIAFHIVKENYRKQAKWDHEELLNEQIGDPPGPLEGENRLNLIALKRAISKLSEKEQAVMSLLLDQELKLSEIALVLEIPLNTVKSHMNRGKKKLKDLLEEKGGQK